DDLKAFPATVRREAGATGSRATRSRSFRLETDGNHWIWRAGDPHPRSGWCVPRPLRGQVRGRSVCSALFSEDHTEDRTARHRTRQGTLQGHRTGAQTMNEQRFESVWDAIESTPGEAANMRARSALAISLAEMIKKRGLTQAEAARRLGVTQPRVSDLMRGKIDLFSLDTLVNMLASAGFRVELHIVEGAEG